MYDTVRIKKYELIKRNDSFKENVKLRDEYKSSFIWKSLKTDESA